LWGLKNRGDCSWVFTQDISHLRKVWWHARERMENQYLTSRIDLFRTPMSDCIRLRWLGSVYLKLNQRKL
jgi:hypothetical protein